MLKRILLIFHLFTISIVVNSQITNWEWAKNGNGYIEALAIENDADGNVYSAGWTGNLVDVYGYPPISMPSYYSVFTAKCDSLGNPIWVATASSDYYVYINDIATDVYKNVFITGYFEGDSLSIGGLVFYNTNVAMFGNAKNFFVSKLDSLGNFVWTKVGNCANDSYGNRICIDNSGNIYIDGVYSFTPMTLDTITLPSGTTEDIFVAKYTTNGDIVWAKHLDGWGYESSVAMSYDGMNNVYIGGFHPNFISIGSDTLFGGGAFILKLDLSGNVVWFKNTSGYIRSISANAIGDVYTSGTFYGTIIIANDTLIAAAGGGYSDFFFAKYDSAGNAIWAKREGGARAENCEYLIADQSGNVYLSAIFESISITIGGNTFSNPASSIGNTNDILYIKYDSSGTFQWVKCIGGDKSDYSNGIVLDENRNMLYALGTFDSSNITFGSTTFTNSGIANPFNVITPNLFLAKLSELPVSVYEISNDSEISIYPNPFQDDFSFSIEQHTKGTDYKIQLTDVIGKIIYEAEINSSQGKVVPSLDTKSGVCFLRVITKDGVYKCKKIVKIN